MDPRTFLQWTRSLFTRAGQRAKEISQQVSGLLMNPLGGQVYRRGAHDWLNAYAESPWIRTVVGAIANNTASNEWQIFVPERSNGRAYPRRRLDGSRNSITRDLRMGSELTLADLLDARNIIVGDASTSQARGQVCLWRGLAQGRSMREAGKVAEQHPAYHLLRNPNPEMSGVDLRGLTRKHLELAGNAFWLIERFSNGEPAELYPLPPDMFRRGPTRREPWFLFNIFGRMVAIPREDVVWFKDFDPANPFGAGVGIAGAVNDEVAADEKASKYNNRLLDNDATPRTALVYEGNMTDAQVERARNAWDHKFRGVWNAAKTAILYGNLKEIKVLGQSPKEMDYKALREHSEKVIRSTWQTPAMILGQIADANRNNAEAALYQFALYVLVPRLIQEQQVIGRDLLSQYPAFPGAWLEHEDPVGEDRDREATIYRMAFYAGGVTQNEYRRAIGEEPVEGGDGFRFSGSTIYVPRMDALPGPGMATGRTPAGEGEAALPAPMTRAALPASREVAAAAPWRSMERADFGEYLLRTLISRTEPLEERFKPALQKQFTAQEKWLRARLRVHLKMFLKIYQGMALPRANGDDVEDLLGSYDDFMAFWTEAFATFAEPWFEEAALEGGTAALTAVDVGVAFDMQSPAVKRLLAARGQKFAKRINEVTWDELKASFLEGVEAGETLRDMEARIEAVMGHARGYRTNRIARTEIVGTYNAASIEGYAQAGVGAKYWLTARDERVRDSHHIAGEEYSSEKAIPLDENFHVGDGEGPCPGSMNSPQEDINCFVDGQVPIYTVEGWRPISSIRPGDLVLTHAGRFRPVRTTLQGEKPGVNYRGEIVRVYFPGPGRAPFLTMTPEHPVQTQRGWVTAENLRESDEVMLLGEECPGCGGFKLLTPDSMRWRYCSKSCASKTGANGQWSRLEHRAVVSAKAREQMHREYASGRRDPVAITAKANARTRELAAVGDCALQRFYRAGGSNWHKKGPEAKAAHMRVLLDAGLTAMSTRHYSVSTLEKSFGAALKRRGLQAEAQHRVLDYVADFAFPEHNILIECDGAYWHSRPENIAHDKIREERLKAAGYTVLHFHEPQILANIEECIDTVERLLKNHNHEYRFQAMRITRIERAQLKRTSLLWNLAVEEDESFIAKGVVVHNCRCAAAPADLPEKAEE